jgi:hypothetical protein
MSVMIHLFIVVAAAACAQQCAIPLESFLALMCTEDFVLVDEM